VDSLYYYCRDQETLVEVFPSSVPNFFGSVVIAIESSEAVLN
jgi:hypothetical protein